jgi:hypothetical protein
MAAAVEPSVDEIVDAELNRIVRLATTDSDVADAINRVREAADHRERTARFEELLDELRSAGIFVCHPVVAAMSVRLLRPAASARTDRAIVNLLDDWDEVQARFGLDVDLQTYVALRANDGRFDRFSGLSAPPEAASAWRVGQMTGLLWQRGAALRAHAAHAPNPFVEMPNSDLLLLRACLRGGRAPVGLAELDAALAPDGTLARDGALDVRCAPEDAQQLRRALLSAACTPIEAGPLLQYPTAVGVRRDAQGLRVPLVLDLVGE